MTIAWNVEWTESTWVEEPTPYEMDALHAEALSLDHLRTGCRIARRVLGGCGYHNPRYAGSCDDEDLYDADTDEYKPGRLTIPCPTCSRKIKPLLSKTHIVLDGGWRWVGLDHQEPYVDRMSVCPGCRNPVLFTTYTPQ